MDKTEKDDEKTVSVTARFPEELIRKVDELAAAMVSNRTAYLNECLRLGFEALFKQRPELHIVIKAHRQREKQASQTLKKTAI